jgi:hypothetical protein
VCQSSSRTFHLPLHTETEVTGKTSSGLDHRCHYHYSGRTKESITSTHTHSSIFLPYGHQMLCLRHDLLSLAPRRDGLISHDTLRHAPNHARSRHQAAALRNRNPHQPSTPMLVSQCQLPRGRARFAEPWFLLPWKKGSKASCALVGQRLVNKNHKQ